MNSSRSDSDVSDEELESFLADVNREFEEHQAELERTERILRRVIVAFIAGVAALILISIAGCGGGEDEPEAACRKDVVGPPAPNETRPLCPEYI